MCVQHVYAIHIGGLGACAAHAKRTNGMWARLQAHDMCIRHVYISMARPQACLQGCTAPQQVLGGDTDAQDLAVALGTKNRAHLSAMHSWPLLLPFCSARSTQTPLHRALLPFLSLQEAAVGYCAMLQCTRISILHRARCALSACLLVPPEQELQKGSTFLIVCTRICAQLTAEVYWVCCCAVPTCLPICYKRGLHAARAPLALAHARTHTHKPTCTH